MWKRPLPMEEKIRSPRVGHTIVVLEYVHVMAGHLRVLEISLNSGQYSTSTQEKYDMVLSGCHVT